MWPCLTFKAETSQFVIVCHNEVEHWAFSDDHESTLANYHPKQYKQKQGSYNSLYWQVYLVAGFVNVFMLSCGTYGNKLVFM